MKIIRMLLVATLILSIASLTTACAKTESRVESEREVDTEEQTKEEQPTETKPEAKIGWEYFKTIDRTGDSFANIRDSFETFEEVGHVNGGTLYRPDDRNMEYGFNANIANPITDDTECTGLSGTIETIFGIDREISVDELESILGVTFAPDIDDTLGGYLPDGDKGYYVQLIVSPTDEILSRDTGVGIYYN